MALEHAVGADAATAVRLRALAILHGETGYAGARLGARDVALAVLAQPARMGSHGAVSGGCVRPAAGRRAPPGAVESGVAILLTNDPLYWTPARRTDTEDAAFQLEEGGALGGELAWRTAGAKGPREAPIVLHRAHRLAWWDYSVVADGRAAEPRRPGQDTARSGISRWSSAATAASEKPRQAL